MMPSKTTIGILIVLGVLTGVSLVLKGLADSTTNFLVNLGMPVQYAGDINSMVFFGGLFLLLILTLKAIPRLSRV